MAETHSSPSAPRPTFFKRALISTVPQATSVAEGLRALFCLGVVFRHAHTFASVLFRTQAIPIALLSDSSSLSGLLLQLSDLAFPYAVDIFVFLSAFFLAPTLLEVLHTVPNRWRRMGQYLLSRFLRLVPVYFIFSLVAKYVSHNWHCAGYSELAFVSYLVKPVTKNCLFPGWSMTTDVHIHITLLLIATTQRTQAGLERVLLLLSIGQPILRTVLWTLSGQPFFPVAINVLDFIGPTAEDVAEKTDSIHSLYRLPIPTYDTSTPLAVARWKMVLRYNAFYFSTVFRMGAAATGALINLHLLRNGGVSTLLLRRPYITATLSLLLLIALVFTDNHFIHPEVRARQRILAALHYLLRFPGAHVIVSAIITLGHGSRQGTNNQVDAMGRLLRMTLGSGFARVFARASYAVYLGHFALLDWMVPIWRVGIDESAVDRDEIWEGAWLWLLRVTMTWFAMTFVVALGVDVVEEVCLMGRRVLMGWVQKRMWKTE